MSLALAPLNCISFHVLSRSINAPYIIFNIVIIFSPTIGYFDQLRKMIIHKSPHMYNKHTTLIQIFANLCRFIYWMFEPFKIYLLGQSIAVFSLQIVLSYLSFYYSTDNPKLISPAFNLRRTRIHTPDKEDLYHYVCMLKSRSGLDFTVGFIFWASLFFSAFGIGSLLIGVKHMSTVIILVSNILDSTTSLPQFYQVVFLGEVDKISYVLVAQFISGDLLKLILFTVGGAAWPFIFGAVTQICLDSILAFTLFSNQDEIKEHIAESKKSSLIAEEADSEFEPLLTVHFSQ